jgi:two-component system response regulator
MKDNFILLVEDNYDDELLTIRAFKKNNIRNELIVVHDGVEALDFLFRRDKYVNRTPSGTPEIVLLDIKLPKLNGIEVLKGIRNDKRTSLIPVIILTSSKEEDDLIQCYQNRANSYIRKPVDFNEFIHTVNSLGLYWLALNEPPPTSKKV